MRAITSRGGGKPQELRNNTKLPSIHETGVPEGEERMGQMKNMSTKWPISDTDISTIIVVEFNIPTVNTDTKTRQKSLKL